MLDMILMKMDNYTFVRELIENKSTLEKCGNLVLSVALFTDAADFFSKNMCRIDILAGRRVSVF